MFQAISLDIVWYTVQNTHPVCSEPGPQWSLPMQHRRAQLEKHLRPVMSLTLNYYYYYCTFRNLLLLHNSYIQLWDSTKDDATQLRSWSLMDHRKVNMGRCNYGWRTMNNCGLHRSLSFLLRQVCKASAICFSGTHTWLWFLETKLARLEPWVVVEDLLQGAF